MTNFEKFKIASLVALAWERREYTTINNAEAYAHGYDVDGDVLIWEGNDAVDCVALADSAMPDEVEVGVGSGKGYTIFILDMTTGELRNA